MADNTLKEYLIALGFHVDDATWRKYVGAVSTAGRSTAELGSAAIEAATAIELAVARIARQYESVYYLSESTGKSIGALQTYQYGMRQVGISADSAAAAATRGSVRRAASSGCSATAESSDIRCDLPAP